MSDTHLAALSYDARERVLRDNPACGFYGSW
jgi:hypothetical protein